MTLNEHTLSHQIVSFWTPSCGCVNNLLLLLLVVVVGGLELSTMYQAINQQCPQYLFYSSLRFCFWLFRCLVVGGEGGYHYAIYIYI